MLIPNPFYAAYSAGALAAGCEPVYLPATRESHFLPDLNALDDALLARTVAFYLASPSNPQGAVAGRAYLEKLGALARRFGFLVFADECYCEIYSEHPPAGMLEASGPDFANVVVFHSLSKRSNLPGLRVGFVAGDRRFLAAFLELRNVAAPQVPGPAQHVGVAAMATRRMCWRIANSIPSSSISPIRSSVTATATNVRPADFFYGSTSPATAAARS